MHLSHKCIDNGYILYAMKFPQISDDLAVCSVHKQAKHTISKEKQKENTHSKKNLKNYNCILNTRAIALGDGIDIVWCILDPKAYSQVMQTA